MGKRGIIGILGMIGLSLVLHADDPGMLERMDISSKKAVEAINAAASGKKIKPDPALESQFNGKDFGGGGNFVGSGKSGKMSAFRYDEKVSSEGFKTTRSFFGIKNPWIGREVPDMKTAPLMARGILPGDKTFATEDVDTRSLPGRERNAFLDNADVKTRPFLGKGKSQGAVDHMGGKVKKEMTVDEVREILNKNR